jgi:glycosyltransferase involved in cell wall biosynthesis
LDDDFLGESSESAQLRSVSFLLRAMEVVWSKNPCVQLRLVGKPSPRLEARSEQLDSLQLVGYREHHQLPEEYAAADIGVYPRSSDMGGRGSIKILECLAAGLPLVCTSASEAHDATSSGAALAADDAHTFGGSILTLVENWELRNILGQRGLHYAEDFSWDAIAPAYDAALDELLSESSQV